MMKLRCRGVEIDLDKINGFDYDSLSEAELFLIRSENRTLRKVLQAARRAVIASNAAIKEQRSKL